MNNVNALVKITDLTAQLGLSSRSLRYYEQVGLIRSIRPAFEKYRFYDTENIDRLKQIIVLRKMEIPIKDILRIYESESMSVVVETFVNRISTIDDEIGALSELKHITSEFLQTMQKNGVTKVSALPLLYEEMEKQFELLEEREPITYGELGELSERLKKPVDPAILSLPNMRVVSSFLKSNPQESDTDGFWRWLHMQKQLQDIPGTHKRFEYQTETFDVVIQQIPDGYRNNSDYLDFYLEGGLFAAINLYLDEDLGGSFHSLIKYFDDNKFYQIDYNNDGSLRHPAMLENLISPDDKRSLVTMLVPVKKRFPNPALFDLPEEVTDISIDEIEAANPTLWTAEVELDRLTPINNPHYRMTGDGEVEYIGWVLTRVLDTNVKVKLPYRVDVEFWLGDDNNIGYGATGESLRIYHGSHGLDHHYPFTINAHNSQAILFHQPVFRNMFSFSGRSRILTGGYNKLTWIIGNKHLACIINGEVRYCGVGFAYMSLDLSREEPQPIIIGSEKLKYIGSISVSQLTETTKNKIKTGELIMMSKQSNNIIPIIHRLVTDEYGENYWFNGCAKYVMEPLGETDYDYWFFAGITGDVFTQHYTYTKYSGDALSSYMMDEEMGGNPAEFVEETFAKCGYAATFVHQRELRKNTEMYLNTLTSYIDKGIPVIAWGQHLVGVLVGYEDYGKTLLYITGNKNEPERISLEKLLQNDANKHIVWEKYDGGWIFVGEKKKDIPLAKIYRKAISEIPKHMGIKTDIYCFGAEAFRAMANDIENGKFDDEKEKYYGTINEFDAWAYYTNFICVLATNGSCCHEFLKRAQRLNPDMTFLEEISRLYKRIGEMWNNDSGNDLEALGGGFNVTFEILQDKERRGKIAAKLREFAAVTDEIVRVLTEGMAKENLICDSFEYVHLGKLRFIGINASCTGEEWEDLWKRSGEFMPPLETLAIEYGADITENCSMMHHNGNEVDSENHFLAGRFFKAGTGVPEGYDYFDVPTEYAAYAVYTTQEYDGALGSAYYATRNKILADNVVIPYPHAYWHAEVYTNGRPHAGEYRFAYMFSVDKKA